MGNGAKTALFINNQTSVMLPIATYSKATASGFDNITVGDFNGDGNLDTVDGSGMALGNGSGGFQTPILTGVGNQFDVTVADLNGDGYADIVSSNDNAGIGDVSVVLGNGDGTFQPVVNYVTGTGSRGLVVVDLNMDGKLDIAVADLGTSTVKVLQGKGDGTFKTALSFIAGASCWGIDSADMNGDGKPDLIVNNFGSSNVSILINNTP